MKRRTGGERLNWNQVRVSSPDHGAQRSMEDQDEAMQDPVAFTNGGDAAMHGSPLGSDPAGQDGGSAPDSAQAGGDSAAQGQGGPGPEQTLDLNQTQWQQRMMVRSCERLC